MKTMNELMDRIKRHPDFSTAGMVLCHNGVVRETSRDGRKVRGLRVAVNRERLAEVLDTQRRRPGILDILISINDEKDLAVGDDVMFLIVAGDIRENVIAVLTDTLNDVKATVTSKTEFFED